MIEKSQLKRGQMFYECYRTSKHIIEAYYIIVSLFDKNGEPHIQWYDVNQMIVREEHINSFISDSTEHDIESLHLVATLEE